MEWILKEENELMDSVAYADFSYGFRYFCPGYPIYQIEDKATWELGGKAEGNTFIMRNGFGRSVVELDQGKYYYSDWDMTGIDNPHIFHHLPLYTQLQGFTFQYDEAHTLITVHKKPSHVRSLFLKEKDDNKLFHFNQFYFDLAEEAVTPPRKILAGIRKGQNRTREFNHFLRVRESIQFL